MAAVSDIFALAWKHHQAGGYAVAEQLYRQVLQVNPRDPDAWCFLGAVCQAQGRHAEAEEYQRKAVQILPDHPSAGKCLGIVVALQGRLDESAAIFDDLLRRDPKDPEALNNLGLVRAQQGRWDEALAQFALSLAILPDYGEAHWNRSLVWLVLGRFEEGSREYEWRWTQASFRRRNFPQPLWDGSPLNGRNILLHAEQGLGDMMQFIRYARLVKERGAGTVILECHPPLVRLLTGVSGIDRVVPLESSLPAFGVHAPLASLPWIFGTTVASIPANVPYLHADPGLVDHWQNKLAHYTGLKIGIAWQGNPTYRDDRWRSINLDFFEGLSRLPWVNLISLQKGPGSNQLLSRADQFPIIDLGDSLDVASGPFMDTAAVMKNLDLVICSDTAIAHLAGALGVPVWVALAHVPDWRWLLEREDCPWYPSMRLIRQQRFGDWQGVFERIVADVRQMTTR